MLPFYQKAVFDLPSGPNNLAALFPAIDWSQVDEYSVALKSTGDAVLVTTPQFKTGCCCNEDTVRVVFENALGKWDAVNFEQTSIQTQTTSSGYQRSLPVNFEKTDTGQERFNVQSNDTWTATTACYDESAMQWLMELVRTAKAFIAWTGTEGQPDSFLPIVIEDGKYDKKKLDDRYIYVFTIIFHMSNDAIVQRN